MTIWTIRIALLLFAACFLFRIHSDTPGKTQKLARWLWTWATLVYCVHVLSAFHEFHDWSHSEAVQHTAEQSRKMTGWAVGAGIYFNHLFTLLCVAETLAWWLRPILFQQRSNWINWLVYGYFGFIAFNGAVVFAAGPVRWVSIAIAAILLAALIAKMVRQKTDGRERESERHESQA